MTLDVCLVLTLECPGDQDLTGRTTVLVAQPLTPVITSALWPPPGAGLAALSLVRQVGPVTRETAGVAALQLVLAGQRTDWCLLTAGEERRVTTGEVDSGELSAGDRVVPDIAGHSEGVTTVQLHLPPLLTPGSTQRVTGPGTAVQLGGTELLTGS